MDNTEEKHDFYVKHIVELLPKFLMPPPEIIDSVKPKEPKYAWPHRQILTRICFRKGLKKIILREIR